MGHSSQPVTENCRKQCKWGIVGFIWSSIMFVRFSTNKKSAQSLDGDSSTFQLLAAWWRKSRMIAASEGPPSTSEAFPRGLSQRPFPDTRTMTICVLWLLGEEGRLSKKQPMKSKLWPRCKEEEKDGAERVAHKSAQTRKTRERNLISRTHWREAKGCRDFLRALPI